MKSELDLNRAEGRSWNWKREQKGLELAPAANTQAAFWSGFIRPPTVGGGGEFRFGREKGRVCGLGLTRKFEFNTRRFWRTSGHRRRRHDVIAPNSLLQAPAKIWQQPQIE